MALLKMMYNFGGRMTDPMQMDTVSNMDNLYGYAGGGTFRRNYPELADGGIVKLPGESDTQFQSRLAFQKNAARLRNYGRQPVASAKGTIGRVPRLMNTPSARATAPGQLGSATTEAANEFADRWGKYLQGLGPQTREKPALTNELLPTAVMTGIIGGRSAGSGRAAGNRMGYRNGGRNIASMMYQNNQ